MKLPCRGIYGFRALGFYGFRCIYRVYMDPQVEDPYLVRGLESVWEASWVEGSHMETLIQRSL